MVPHACNPSTQKAKVELNLASRSSAVSPYLKINYKIKTSIVGISPQAPTLQGLPFMDLSMHT